MGLTPSVPLSGVPSTAFFVDLQNHTANVVAVDISTQPQIKVVNVQFPFNPPPSEGREEDKAIAAVKAVLQ
jgi:hypothetical protein